MLSFQWSSSEASEPIAQCDEDVEICGGSCRMEKQALGMSRALKRSNFALPVVQQLRFVLHVTIGAPRETQRLGFMLGIRDASRHRSARTLST